MRLVTNARKSVAAGSSPSDRRTTKAPVDARCTDGGNMSLAWRREGNNQYSMAGFAKFENLT